MSVNELIGFAWAEQNKARNYPFAVDATLVDVSESIRLPTSLLIGGSLSVPYDNTLDIDRFYVSRVQTSETSITVTISYLPRGGATEVVGTCSVATSQTQPVGSSELETASNWGQISGYLVFGSVISGDAIVKGDYSFSLAGGRLDVDIIHPGVSGFDLVSVDQDSQLLGQITGDIELVARNNLNIRLDSVVDGVSTVVFSAADLAAFGKTCECSEDGLQPIYSINGIPVAEDGSFQFVGQKCTDISVDVATVFVSSSCGDPCCDCDELAAVSAGVDAAIEHIRAIAPPVSQLEDNLEEMKKVKAVLDGIRESNSGQDQESDPQQPPTTLPPPTTTTTTTTIIPPSTLPPTTTTTTPEPTTTTTTTQGPTTTLPPGVTTTSTTQGPTTTTTPEPTTTTTPIPPATTTTTPRPTTTTHTPTTSAPEDLYLPAEHLVVALPNKIVLANVINWGAEPVDFYTGGQNYEQIVVDHPRRRILALRDANGFAYIDYFDYQGNITKQENTLKAWSSARFISVNTRNGAILLGGDYSLSLKSPTGSFFFAIQMPTWPFGDEKLNAVLPNFWDDRIIVCTHNAVYVLDPANIPSTREQLRQLTNIPCLDKNPLVDNLAVCTVGVDRRAMHVIAARRDGTLLGTDAVELSGTMSVIDRHENLTRSDRPSTSLRVANDFTGNLYIGGDPSTGAPGLVRSSIGNFGASTPPTYEAYPGITQRVRAIGMHANDVSYFCRSLRRKLPSPGTWTQHFFQFDFIATHENNLREFDGSVVATSQHFGFDFEVNVLDYHPPHQVHLSNFEGQLLPPIDNSEVDNRPGYTGIQMLDSDYTMYGNWIKLQKGTLIGATQDLLDQITSWEAIVGYVRQAPLNPNDNPNTVIYFPGQPITPPWDLGYDNGFIDLSFGYYKNLQTNLDNAVFRITTVASVDPSQFQSGMFMTELAQLDSAVVAPTSPTFYQVDGWVVDKTYNRLDGGALPTKSEIDTSGNIPVSGVQLALLPEFTGTLAYKASWPNNFTTSAMSVNGFPINGIRTGDRSAAFIVESITEHPSGRAQLKLRSPTNLTQFSFRPGDSLFLRKDNSNKSNFSAMIEVAMQPTDPRSVVLRLPYSEVVGMSPKYASLVEGWVESISKASGNGTWLNTWIGDMRQPMLWQLSFSLLDAYNAPTGWLAMIYNSGDGPTVNPADRVRLNALGVQFTTAVVAGTNPAGGSYPREELTAEIHNGEVDFSQYGTFTSQGKVAEMVVSQRYFNPTVAFHKAFLKLWARIDPNTGQQQYGISDVASTKEVSFSTVGGKLLGTLYGINCTGLSDISLDDMLVRVDHPSRSSGFSSFGHFANV